MLLFTVRFWFLTESKVLPVHTASLQCSVFTHLWDESLSLPPRPQQQGEWRRLTNCWPQADPHDLELSQGDSSAVAPDHQRCSRTRVGSGAREGSAGRSVPAPRSGQEHLSTAWPGSDQNPDSHLLSPYSQDPAYNSPGGRHCWHPDWVAEETEAHNRVRY
jgi:hypothetical protein